MRLLFLFVYGIFLIYGSPALGTEATTHVLDPALVTWKSLTYKSQSFFGTATAVVELQTCLQPEIPATHDDNSSSTESYHSPPLDKFCLSVTNIIKPCLSANRFYQTKVWFSPDDGAAFRRLRLLRGEKDYLKDYIFTPSGVCRYRKTPRNPEEEKLKPELWSNSEKTFYPFPESLSATTIVSESSLLLYYLSARIMKADMLPEEICVFHKKQYHLVKLLRGTPNKIQVDYIVQQDGQNKLVKRGEMEPASYRLISRPVKKDDGTKAEKFSFMGLAGDITIYFDEEARVPIRIDGDIPLIGRVHFMLQQITKIDRK